MKKLVSVLLALALCVAFAAVCGAEEVHEHSWGGWQTQSAATCTREGVQVRICTTCGEVESDTIPTNNNHSWGGWQTQSAATCVREGVQVRICSACGETERDTIPTNNNHSWGGWETQRAATCAVEGVKVRLCSACGETERDTIPTNNNHSWGGWETQKAPTCTADGLQVRLCGACGETEKNTLSATGHSPVTVAGKDATCTATGLTDGEQCSVCGAVLKAQQTIPAKGHTEVVIPGKAETCSENGLTDGAKCSVCGVVTSAQQVINATGHSFEVRVYAATTTSRGYTKHTCTTCGETFKDNWVPKLASVVVTETPKPTTEPQTSLYGDIVTDASRDVTAYDCTLETSGNLLEIVAAAEADGSYALRNLHITVELLEQLKSDGIEYIRFVVGDAALLLPLSAFDSEDVAMIVADMKQELTGYVVTVDPTAKTASSENGCEVSVVVTTLDGDEMDITAFVAGLQLTAGGQTVDVTESAVYPIG